MDEGGNPLSGIGINLSGINQKGLTLIPTFHIQTRTDKDGEYEMSQTVPTKTEWLEIRIIDYSTIFDGVEVDTSIINRYIPYTMNGELIRESKSKIHMHKYGKTVDANFVLKKK